MCVYRVFVGRVYESLQKCTYEWRPELGSVSSLGKRAVCRNLRERAGQVVELVSN